jgi:serine/threonine protein phosphatase PrpC
MTPAHSNIYPSFLNWLNRVTTKKAIRRVAEKSIAISTDIGVSRGENQDKSIVMRIGRNDGGKFTILALCDGMGGMESGKDCAAKAIATFADYCAYTSDMPIEKMLENAVRFANDVVFSEYQGRGGATLSALCVDSTGNVVGVNVGDSRIYSYAQRKLIQHSSDDTLEGQLGDGLELYAGRRDLLQHVGVGPDIEPHIISIDSIREVNGSLFLCTDGIHFLGKDLLALILGNASEPAFTAIRLTELSQWCGGKDNATAILISSYSDIVEFNGRAILDVLEVWDAFGEIQFHNRLQNKVETVNTNESITNSELKNVKRKRKPKAKTGKKTKSKPAVDMFITDETEVSAEPQDDEKPELEIEFNSTRGK